MKIRAFSILEAALAILLAGVFSALIIPYWQLIEYKRNYAITVNKANYIRKAMEGYVARYGFLPSAASDVSGIAEKNRAKGFVPYRTLGISKYYLKDGFNREFCYVVNARLMLDSYSNQSILPVWMPYHIKLQSAIVHFCRIFDCSKDKWNNVNVTNLDSKVFDDLKIYISTKKDGLKELKFTTKEISPHFYKSKNLEELVSSKKYSYADSVAWVLISSKGKTWFNKKCGYIVYDKVVQVIDLYSRDILFWQSRFNLAAQIKAFCLLIPLDVSYLQGSALPEG